MTISSAAGNIVDVAPKTAEAGALWLRSGFNLRSATWQFRILKEYSTLAPLEPGPSLKTPWKSRHDSLWELNPAVEKLRYIYVFANPSDGHAYTGLNRVREAVVRCLDRLSEVGVKSLAMLHIPAVETGDIPTREDNINSAREMIASIKHWQSTHEEHPIEVVLVDRTNDFAELIAEPR